jgi:hypothetical protein
MVVLVTTLQTLGACLIEEIEVDVGADRSANRPQVA